jgi:hypothetical protein
MTALTTLQAVLQTGIHSARPAADAVGSGSLYACTTHQLIYQTDGAAWSTWATLGSGGTPPGGELDYVQTTTALTVTATSSGAAQAFIDGNAVSYDGSTRIKVEFFCPNAEAASGTLVVMLVDGASTVVGWLCELNGITATPIKCELFLTPSAASHTYHIKAWKTGGTCVLGAGSGGAADVQAFMRITKA